LRYANAITYAKGSIKSVAISKASSADTATELANIRALFHASLAVAKVDQIFKNFSAGASFVDWFSSIECKEAQVKEARASYGSAPISIYFRFAYSTSLADLATLMKITDTIWICWQT
jgi:hypothetical protein